MNHHNCGWGNNANYNPPSEKQREVWALERELECAELMLDKAKEQTLRDTLSEYGYEKPDTSQ